MWKLFKFTNLLYLLVSSYIWFAFFLPRNYVPMSVCAVLLVCFAFGHFKAVFNTRAFLCTILVIVYSLYSTFIIDLNYGILTFMSYIPAVLLFILDKPLQEDLLGFVTKWFSIIMGVSLGFFGLHFILPLPSFPFLPNEISTSYLTFDNYFFFMKTNMYLSENAGVFRFGGPFLEPGHQSMICCLILFANRCQIKKQPLMWILVVSILMSFSLAGYLTLIIGWALIKIRNVYSMAFVVGVVGGAWFFVESLWNDGDNAVNQLILQRLEYDSQKGIKGNNRTLKHTDYFFKECVRDGTAVLGVRTQKVDTLKISGAGYKIFILRYGIIGTIFVALLYLFFIPPGCNRRYAVSFLLLMAIIFLQRAYPSWYSWLFPYVVGLGVMRNRHLHDDSYEETFAGDGNVNELKQDEGEEVVQEKQSEDICILS